MLACMETWFLICKWVVENQEYCWDELLMITLSNELKHSYSDSKAQCFMFTNLNVLAGIKDVNNCVPYVPVWSPSYDGKSREYMYDI